MRIPFVSRRIEKVAAQQASIDHSIEAAHAASRHAQVAQAMVTGYCGTVTVSNAEREEYERRCGSQSPADYAQAAVSAYYATQSSGR